MRDQLFEQAGDLGIRRFLFTYTDIEGISRAKIVSANEWNHHLKGSVNFAAFPGNLGLAHDSKTLKGIPDFDGLIQLPWNGEVAWVPLIVLHDDVELEQLPRNCLRRMVRYATTRNLTVKTGVECEFFLLAPDEFKLADGQDSRYQSCYDQNALMRQYSFLTELTDYMEALGWHPYQTDHEDGCGQYEINWQFADALKSADRHCFFKFMAKSIANKHQLRITFMAKPFSDRVGNGCHFHISAWAGNQNAFLNETADYGLSDSAYAFLGGLMENAPQMCAIACSTVNSYRRLLPPLALGSDTWGRNTVTFSDDNRTHMFRIPDKGRIEFRLPDGATNPYLISAAIIACGLDGLERGLNPGPPMKADMSAPGLRIESAVQLPRDLHEALKCLEGSRLLRRQLGESTISSYVFRRWEEYNTFSRRVTDWERDATWDC